MHFRWYYYYIMDIFGYYYNVIVLLILLHHNSIFQKIYGDTWCPTSWSGTPLFLLWILSKSLALSSAQPQVWPHASVLILAVASHTYIPWVYCVLSLGSGMCVCTVAWECLQRCAGKQVQVRMAGVHSYHPGGLRDIHAEFHQDWPSGLGGSDQQTNIGKLLYRSSKPMTS